MATDEDDKTTPTGLVLDSTRPRIVVVCGACDSGKSYAACTLLRSMFEQGILKWIRIYSHTAAANHEYDWAPEGCVHPISLDAVSKYHKNIESPQSRRWKIPPKECNHLG